MGEYKMAVFVRLFHTMLKVYIILFICHHCLYLCNEYDTTFCWFSVLPPFIYQKSSKKAVVEHVYANYSTINLCHPNRLKMKMLKINSLLNHHQKFYVKFIHYKSMISY